MRVHSQRKPRQAESDRLCKLYVDDVRRFDVVREVRVHEGEDSIAIWTLISAPPFEDELREPIYDAQINVLLEATKANIDFRVVNLEEYPVEALDGVIPTESKLIWNRDIA